jgi:hypothetical protein
LASDGSAFHGTGATGRIGRKNYYFNPATKMRLSAEDLESEAKEIVSGIIRGSSNFREAIARKSTISNGALQRLDSHLAALRTEIEEREIEKRNEAKRLDLISVGASESELEMCRAEYRSALERIRASIEQNQKTVKRLEERLSHLREEEIDSAAISARARELQDRIQDQDPVALKNAYRNLFEAIYVEPNATEGVVRLSFTIRDQHSAITEEEKGSVGERMVARFTPYLKLLKHIKRLSFPAPSKRAFPRISSNYTEKAFHSQTLVVRQAQPKTRSVRFCSAPE